MKLYYAPGACSLGIHLLLQEIGRPFDVEKVNTREGEHHAPGYVAMNPKSKVPTLLRDDGSVLTEFPAIAYWLARAYPDAALLPAGLEPQTRALELIDYVVATMHMQGFQRMFRPGRFSFAEAEADRVKAHGAEIFNKAMALVDDAIAGHDYAVGAFSIADAALFYVEYWASRSPELTPMPAHIAAHWARMQARPAVQAVFAAEGLKVAA